MKISDIDKETRDRLALRILQVSWHSAGGGVWRAFADSYGGWSRMGEGETHDIAVAKLAEQLRQEIARL